MFALIASTALAAELSRKYKTELYGNHQVPPVETMTTAEAKFKFDKEFTHADFKLKVKDGMAITMAHLHCAPKDANGPVVATLFGEVPGGFHIDGTLAKFTLTEANLHDTAGCPNPINTMEDLAMEMQAGNIYVNVHSAANPSGEVRGQVYVD